MIETPHVSELIWCSYYSTCIADCGQELTQEVRDEHDEAGEEICQFIGLPPCYEERHKLTHRRERE